MAGASEALQIVRQRADGTYEWGSHGPLSQPGERGPALLANFLASDSVLSTSFQITPSGDWLAIVSGVTYNILPGVIPATGRFVFIGVPAPNEAFGGGDPNNVTPRFSSSGSLSAIIPSSIPAPFAGDGALTATVTEAPGDYSDGFGRPDGDPGVWWTTITQTTSYGTIVDQGGKAWEMFAPRAAGGVEIVNEELTTTVANKQQHGVWNNPLPATDHRAQVAVGTIVPDVVYLGVRASAVDGHIRAEFLTDGSAKLYSYEGDLLMGTSTQRAGHAAVAPLLPGQILALAAVGTTYVALVDDVEVMRWDDATGLWNHVDNAHLQVEIGLLTTVVGVGAIDNFFAEDLSGHRFTGEGSLSATVTGVTGFSGVGALSARVLDKNAPNFSGEGSLSASVWDVLTPVIPAVLSGGGALTATVEEATREPKPEFAGLGTLSARLTTYPKPVSHWTFYEAAGMVARSLIAGYRLDLDATAGGWYGKALNGVAYGDPGAPGIMPEWSVAMQLTYNSATPDGPAILENSYEGGNTHFSVGFDKRGGAAYPGVWVETVVAGSNWVWSTTPIPLGVPHTLVCTCSVSDATVKLYLDGVEILSVGGQTMIHRDFVNGVSLYDRTYMPDAYLDELTYWDSCLTPSQVAGLPPAVKMPVSDFDFRERGGPTAASLTGSYTLAASDPVTAWDNTRAVEPFTGVVATGVQNEWTVALDLTLAGGAALTSGDGLRAIMSLLATGTSILESAAENVIGLNHASGYAYPGLQVAGGAWEYSGVPVPLGSLHKLVCVGSVAAAATVLYLDGMPILTVAGAIARNFAAAATLLDDQDVASVDNVAYWDIAMTPDQVAALPPLGPSRYTPISNFDFREASGPTAASTRGAYVLAATDPATAWNGQEAKGEFTGVVGVGYLVAWTAAYTITLNALGTTDEIVEDCYDNTAIHTFALAFRYSGGAAYPGFFTTQAGSGGWVFSTTPIPAGIQYTLVFVSDPNAPDGDSDSKLYLNGGLIAEAEYSTYRQLDQPTLLMGPSRPDASIDNVTYWDIALTPDEVLDIPAPIEPPIPPREITAQFGGGGTLINVDTFVPDPYSDDFDRGDGPAGSGWELVNANVANELVIKGNELAIIGSNELGDRLGVWVNPLPGNDQRVECRIGGDVAATYTLLLRTSLDDGHVRAQFNVDSDSVAFSAYEGDLVMGNTTPGSPVVAPPMTTGTLLAAEAVGGNYIAYIDGVEVHRTTLTGWAHVDDAHLRVGVGMLSLPVVYSGPDHGSLDDFQATNLVPEANPEFGGSGLLSREEDTPPALSHFDFHEAGGSTTEDIIGGYTIAATDPATAWDGEAAVGEFEGIVGTGTMDEWSALFVVSIDSANAADGPSRLEITYDDVSEYRLATGFNHVGGVVYPGLSVGVAPWQWSTTAIPLGVPHMLVCVGSGGGHTLYLDGVEILNVASGGSTRYFDVAATLMDSGYEQIAHLDNVTYLDFALTPAQVAAIPFDKVRAPFESDGALEAFAQDYSWYHDNFNRPDGPPGDSWQLTHKAGTGDLAIVGNQLTVSEANQYQYGWWKRALPGPDHKVEVRIGRDLPNMISLMVRSSQADGWVEAQFSPSSGTVWILTYEGAWMGITGVTERSERTGFTLAEGTLISMEVIGPHYTVRVNGAVAGHWYDIGNEWANNDASHVNVAVCVQGAVGAGVDYFKATDLTGVPFEYPIHGQDDFDRPDGPLGANWTVTHIWEAITATVKNGQLWQSGNGNTRYMWANPLPGDDMSIEFTVGDDPANGYLVRMRQEEGSYDQVKGNVGMSTPPPGQGMEEYMGPSIATQGSSNDGGVGRASSGWDSTTDPAEKILFEAVGQWYSLSVDGRRRVSWKDTGGIVPVHRHVGFELSGSTDPQYAEATVDNVVIRDLSGPVDDALVMREAAPAKKAPAKRRSRKAT